MLTRRREDQEEDGRKMEASTRMSSLCSERKTTWRGVNSTTSEALTNYCLRKIISNILSLLFLDFSLRKFHQRDSSGDEVFSTRDKLSLVSEVRIFPRVVVYRLTRLFECRIDRLGIFFILIWFDSEC